MHVLAVYNEPVLPAEHPEADSESEIVVVAGAIATQLERGGLQISRHGIGRDFDAFRTALGACRPDVVLNLFEGFGDDPTSECRFAQLLEEADVAFTGASSQTLWRAGRKDIAKKLFRQAGIATPPFEVVDELPFAECRLKWPVIVKPAFRDASVGIEQASIVVNQPQLEDRVVYVASEYGVPVLVEEFVSGREISAAIIDGPEPFVLPLVETVFDTHNGDWPIDSYDAKWQLGSRDYEVATLRYPAELPAGIGNRAAEMARDAFRVLDCRGFATADFRLGTDRKLYLLELNPNANMKPSQCFTELLRIAGRTYGDFLSQMLHLAIKQSNQSAPSSAGG